ncbi:MAG: YcaO-like family protein [Acidobacteriota bacterium]
MASRSAVEPREPRHLRQTFELRDVDWSDPFETVRKGKRLISSRTGLIRHVGPGAFRQGDTRCFSLGVSACDTSRFSSRGNSGIKSGGGGATFEVALAASIGEAAERYCMLFYDRDEMIFAPHREVAADAVAPELLRLFSRPQVENPPPRYRADYFDEDAPVSWVWGWSLTENRPKLVPATLVYLGFEYRDGEAVTGRNASSGLSAGGTLEEAILSGLYEVIERDAFTIHWLQRHMGPRIEIDDEAIDRLVRERYYPDHPDVDLAVYDVSLDLGVPSVLTILTRPAEYGTVLCVGSASRLSARDAVYKTLVESSQALPYFRFQLDRLADWEPAEDFSDLRNFEEHSLLYIKRPELKEEAFRFCREVDRRVVLSDLPELATGRPLGDLERTVGLLAKAGYEVVVADITTPDIAEVGFHVVRVIVPGLVPLHGDHNMPFLGQQRLESIPRDLDWQRFGWDPTAGINPYPHPFP